MKILLISGSLRADSTNGILVKAFALAATSVTSEIYDGLESIPPFNPDRDIPNAYSSIEDLRSRVRNSDVVLFSTPEYAHGIPGSLKNALDWIVGSGELSEKPVALLNASTRGKYAQDALREVLKTMNAAVVTEAETSVDLIGQSIEPEELAKDVDFKSKIDAMIQKLHSAQL